MDCHMMVSNPEQVNAFSERLQSALTSNLSSQWVDAIAGAGGKLYCFHIEATCGFLHRMPVSSRGRISE